MLNRFMGTIAIMLALLVASAGAKENILYSFTGAADGGSPHSGLAHDRFGNLYGITAKGGQGQCFGLGCGTVFELIRNGGSWTKSTLHTFDGGVGGGVPVGTLTIDAQGNLYGVTEQGGTGPCDSVLGGGCGVIYRLSPNGKGKFDFAVLYSFSQPGTVDDGAYPNAGVVIDKNGSLFGTTEFGGSFVCDCGVVYRLSRNQDRWMEVVLYSFQGISQGGSDVSFPAGPVILGRNGTILGTGTGGGDVLCDLGCGGVFQLIPNGHGFDDNVLHIFESGDDGSEPWAGLTVDANGNLFGATAYGGGGTGCPNGDNGCGTIFELTPNGDSYDFNIIFRFQGPDGYGPFAELLADNNGNLYGTTEGGGAASAGAGFRLSPVAGQWRETGLYSFGTGTDGATPVSPLTGNRQLGFFGTTAQGGKANWGTVFRFK
jgi:uncharacterized repeat protein (TIGR03803 family)